MDQGECYVLKVGVVVVVVVAAVYISNLYVHKYRAGIFCVEVALQIVKYRRGLCGGMLSPANGKLREGPHRTGVDPRLRLSTPPSPQRAESRRLPNEGGMHAHEGEHAALMPYSRRVFCLAKP